jgi:membrane protein implicated in regulation of membrane protease activity
MSDILADPAFRPFLVAAIVLFGLVLVEMLSLLLGTPASHSIDHLLGLDSHAALPEHGLHSGPAHAGGAGPLAEAIGWVNVGRIPLLMLLMAGLAGFSVAGILIQTAAHGLGIGLPPWLGSLMAIAVALPSMRQVSRLLQRIIPGDKSFAIDNEDLIGRTGEVTVGPVRTGVVARIKVQDRYGNWHFPRVVPFEPSHEIAAGAQVLIVARNGTELAVAPAEGALAVPRD